jgi:hypothetical protein
LEDTQVVIKKGSVGTHTNLQIDPMTREQYESGNAYAIPVTLTRAEGAGVLEGANTLIYVLRNIPYADVPETAGHRIQFNMDHYGGDLKQMSFTAITIEFLFKIVSWTTNVNNRSLIYNNGRTVKNEIYTRIENGSSGLDKANIEFKFGDYVTAFPPSGKFEVGKWYHVAFVLGNLKAYIYIDGQQVGFKDTSVDEIISSTDLSPLANGDSWTGFCWQAGDTGFNTQVSELRIWNIVRTRDQIRENMYTINPTTPGLLGYWRMNDGSGNTFKDYVTPSAGGFVQDGTNPTWVLNQELTVGK